MSSGTRKITRRKRERRREYEERRGGGGWNMHTALMFYYPKYANSDKFSESITSLVKILHILVRRRWCM